MGLRDYFSGKRQAKPVKQAALAVLEPEEPVNFDSVLDWVVGLGIEDYATFTKVCGIYRDANQKAAEAMGIEDKPTSTLLVKKLTNKQIDDGLDSLLQTDPKDLKAAMAAEKPKRKAKKSQSPSKHIEVKD